MGRSDAQERKKNRNGSFRFINKLPLRNSDDALSVNWCEVITRNAQGEITYRNAFATSHVITSDNIADVVAAGRSRWKIEIENNNVLKNHGYHFEHNFSHGKENLASLLTTLNLLAFLMHTALDFLDMAYHVVLQAAPSRRTFFEQVWSLLQFILFKNWEDFLLFMNDG